MQLLKVKLDSLKAEIQEIHLADMPDMDTTKIGLKGSPTRVKATFTPKRQASGEIMEVINPEETAKRFSLQAVRSKIIIKEAFGHEFRTIQRRMGFYRMLSGTAKGRWF